MQMATFVVFAEEKGGREEGSGGGNELFIF